jgi:hypothetical protein
MKSAPCFEPNRGLEDAARIAEQRKNQAIDRLMEKLHDPLSEGERVAFRALVAADERKEKS